MTNPLQRPIPYAPVFDPRLTAVPPQAAAVQARAVAQAQSRRGYARAPLAGLGAAGGAANEFVARWALPFFVYYGLMKGARAISDLVYETTDAMTAPGGERLTKEQAVDRRLNRTFITGSIGLTLFNHFVTSDLLTPKSPDSSVNAGSSTEPKLWMYALGAVGLFSGASLFFKKGHKVGAWWKSRREKKQSARGEKAKEELTAARDEGKKAAQQSQASVKSGVDLETL